MGEFVVVQIKAADGDSWMDYSRCTAAEARGFLAGKPEWELSRWRAKHWITGNLLSKEQLGCMSVYPDGFNEREPREWWRVTMTWEGESHPSFSEVCPYIYKLQHAINVLQSRGLEAQRGDIMRIEIVSEEV